MCWRRAATAASAGAALGGELVPAAIATAAATPAHDIGGVAARFEPLGAAVDFTPSLVPHSLQ